MPKTRKTRASKKVRGGMTLGESIKDLGRILRRAVTPFNPPPPSELFRKRGRGKCGGMNIGRIGGSPYTWAPGPEKERAIKALKESKEWARRHHINMLGI